MFIAQYRFDGRVRRYPIGRLGVFTVSEARREAKAILGDVARGLGPMSERAEDRE